MGKNIFLQLDKEMKRMGEAQADIVPEIKQWLKDSDDILQRIEETGRNLEQSGPGNVSVLLNCL